MRPRLLLLMAAALAACAGPRPCTRSLCPSRLSGSYEMRGWSGAVTITPDVPRPPVLSDSQVTILAGEAEFTHGKTTLRASEAASFRFAVSTRAAATIEVSAGSVSVLLSSSSAPISVLPGAPYLLPAAK